MDPGLLRSLRRREEVGIPFLCLWLVDRVFFSPAAADGGLGRGVRVNKTPFSPSLGVAAGGADVGAVECSLSAAAGGSSSRRSVRDRAVLVRIILCFQAPAGRGGEGSWWCCWVVPFWCRCCWASSPTASRLRPAMVAWGVAMGEVGSWGLVGVLLLPAGSVVVRWSCCWIVPVHRVKLPSRGGGRALRSSSSWSAASSPAVRGTAAVATP